MLVCIPRLYVDGLILVYLNTVKVSTGKRKSYLGPNPYLNPLTPLYVIV